MTEKKNPEKKKKSLGIMFLILGILFVFSIIMAVIIGSVGDDEIVDYNVAIIPITGVISTEESSGIFAQDVASSTDIIKEIERARSDPQVKAVIFEINSPGGSPVTTDEIAQAIEELRKDNITTVAHIREVGASGAYWIASETDHVVANRMSIVGSIGVYGSYIELYGLMNRYNVTYRRLVAGEYKDTGTPLRQLSSAEEAYLQAKLDRLHVYFIEAVAENRNMSVDDVRELATGEIFLGIEAQENGLIDETGGRMEAEAYIAQRLNTTVVSKEFVRERSFFEALMSTMNQNSFYIGEGIASGMVKASLNAGNEYKVRI